MIDQVLTNNGIFVSFLQVANRDKVTLHYGNVTAVLTGDDSGLPVECHLIVILQWCVLFVGNFQGTFGDVVDLGSYRWMNHMLIRDLGSISPDWILQIRQDFRQQGRWEGFNKGWQMIISFLLYGYGAARWLIHSLCGFNSKYWQLLIEQCATKSVFYHKVKGRFGR